MKGLIFRIPTVVADSTLPKLNEVRFTVLKTGTGLGLTSLKLITTTDVVRPVKLSSVLGNISFYSDAGGTVLLGTSISLAAGNVIVYVKATANDVLIFNNAHNISCFGQSADMNASMAAWITTTNSPTTSCSIDTIKYMSLKWFNVVFPVTGDLGLLKDMPTLRYIGVGANSTVSGNLNFISTLADFNGMWDSAFASCTLDLASFPKSITGLTAAFEKGSSILSYTGGTTKDWGKIVWFKITSTNTSLSQADVDNLLISMANTATGGGTIYIARPRTSASDAAVVTLQGKGYAVTVNAAT